jgi:hypothetical protein
MSNFFQAAFGKRNTLVRASGKPLPRWQKRARELRNQSDERKKTDELKSTMFKRNPNLRIHRIYGTVIIDGKERKFSIDIMRDPKEISNNQMCGYLKKFYSDLNNGLIPENHYYALYPSPQHLLNAKKIKHQGLTDYLAKKSGGLGGASRFGRWKAGARRGTQPRISEGPSKPWAEVQWLILGYKFLINEAEQMIIAYRHELRKLGVKLKPYSSWRIRHGEELFLKEIGWTEEQPE